MSLAPPRLAALARRCDEMLELPPAARAAWLAALDATDADLLPHLQRLCDAGTTAGSSSGGSASPGDLSAWPQRLQALIDAGLGGAGAPAAGDEVGPYRLLAPLGEGGMGVVWRAERIDGTLKREVALKLPLASPGQRRWAERFARERDILARLDHPHIARLYDAGLTAEGQPWMAMAVVEGRPITVHADAERLGLAARIALFLQVLDAVQFAHRHLVVHRDLKPSNILVDAGGSVRLLDFGIALPLDEAAADGPLTEVGQALLTPDYAAPEQLMRGPVSTAADIYALGVVLCELLCGRRPFAPSHPGRAAMEHAVLNTEPLRLSRAVPDQQAATCRRAGTPRALARRLRGDLENIVAKALRKDAAERYASAEAFGADLQRHLDGVPVRAHPGSLGYRARKFVARNRLAVGAGAAVALALLTGTVLALWQAREARLEARKAQAVQDFLIGVFDEADPARAQGRDTPVREIVARGARDAHTRLADQPEVRDAVEDALVRIDLKLADYAHALPLAEARRDALRARDGSRGEAYARALLALAQIQSGLLRYGAALALAQEGRQALAGQRGADPLLATELAQSEATSLGMLQRGDEAVALLEDVVAQLTALQGPAGDAVLQARSLLAFNLARTGKAPRAMAILAEIAPLLDRLPKAQALEMASLRAEAGQVMWRAGALAASADALRSGIGEYDRLLGDPNSTAAALRRDLGLALLDRGDALGALEAMRAHGQRARQLYGAADHKTAIAEQAQVMPLLLLGRMSEGAALAQRTLDEFQARIDNDPGRQPELRGMQRQWALGLALTADAARARRVLEDVSARELAAKTAPWRRAFTRLYLAGALRAGGQPELAATVAQEALTLAGSSTVFQARLLAAKAGLTQALALADLGRADAAAQAWNRAQAQLQPLVEPDHPLLDIAAVAQAAVLRAGGQAGQAQAIEAAARGRLHGTRQIELPPKLLLVF